MSLTLLIVGLLSLVEAQVQLPEPPPPANGMVRLLSTTSLTDGSHEVWDIDRTRYDALPVWDPPAGTIPLTLNDALPVAEAWLRRQHPDVKTWLAVNTAMIRGRDGRSWLYRVNFARVGGPASVLFPLGASDQFMVMVLLDRSIVESKRIEGVPPQPVQDRDGAYRVGAGVTSPRSLANPKPNYTADAMREKIQGTVRLTCVVNTNGRCEDISIAQSLDRDFGLDNEAIKTLRQWRFAPGTLGGKPVRVRVIVELSFNLRD